MKNKIVDNKIKTKLQLIKPYVYGRPSISSVTIRFTILLLIQVIMLVLTKSYSAVAVVGSAFLGSAAAASLNYLISHDQPFELLNILTQGIIIGLLLPENYPLITVFFISLATLFISKSILFKSINSWINVPCFAVIIAWFIGRIHFPSFLVTADLVTARNTSVYLIQNGSYPVYEFDSVITSFLNSTVFDWFKITVPEGFVSLLWDSHSVIPAFRFNIITIISSIIIFSDNAFSGIIPTLFLLIYAVLVRVFSPFMFGGVLNQGDVILAMLTSGTLFCATFLIQWFGTIPITALGKVILGIISGLLAFLIMGCGTSPIGMVYTVLLTNIANMLIRVFEEKANITTTTKVISKLLAKGDN